MRLKYGICIGGVVLVCQVLYVSSLLSKDRAILLIIVYLASSVLGICSCTCLSLVPV
uniref:Uncharacterized protein n=1 Tax=Arundo donax TaxID=35708 RepID=A0A0A9GLS6_ARUDO